MVSMLQPVRWASSPIRITTLRATLRPFTTGLSLSCRAPLAHARASVAPDSIDIRQLPGGFGARISSLTSVGNDKSGCRAGKWRSKTALGSALGVPISLLCRAIAAGTRRDDFDRPSRTQAAVSTSERLDPVAEAERVASAGTTATQTPSGAFELRIFEAPSE